MIATEAEARKFVGKIPGLDAEAFDRAVDLRIMRIRRKIEIDPAKPAVIRTIRGGGYLFSPAGDKA